MHKTKQNKRTRQIFKKTRKNKKYYGGSVPVEQPLKKTEGVFDIIGDKTSDYISNVINYGKEKGLRLLGLQTIKKSSDVQNIETMNKINDNLTSFTEGVTNVGSDIANVVNKGSAAIIENINDVLQNPSVGKTTGEAAEDLAETGAKIFQKFNEAANTPEFKEQTKVALDNAAEIADIVVKASDKPVNDAIDILNEAGTKAISGVSSGAIKVATDALAAVPGAGAIVEAGKVINDVSTAVGDVVEASSDATEALSKVVTETSNNINESLEKLEETKHKAENLTNNIPSIPKPNINVVKPNINVLPKPNINVLPKPNINVPNISQQIVEQKGGLKKIKNEKYQVAGRISDSINEFKDPINFSIIKGGSKTKKLLIKSKGKSKRVHFAI
jgi:hypothetical protein